MNTYETVHTKFRCDSKFNPSQSISHQRELIDAIKEESTQPGKEGQEGGQASGQQLWCGNKDPHRSSCTHIKLPENSTLEDFKEARALFEDFDAKFSVHQLRMGEAYATRGTIGSPMIGEQTNRMCQVVYDIEQKFMLLDDANRAVFRQLVISRGINAIFGQQEIGMDFLQFSEDDMQILILLLLPCMSLIYMIDGMNSGGDRVMRLMYCHSLVNQIWASPRDR